MGPEKKDDNKQTPQAKERIFQAAVRLFARQGYSATGMRELAREAEVNLATINYFYGSKQGLLEEVLDNFFKGYLEVVQGSLAGDAPVEDRIRRFIKRAVAYFIENRNLLIIILTQMPFDTPEITAFKAERVTRLIEVFSREAGLDLSERLGRQAPLPIVGPAFLGLVSAHFIVRPVIERMGLVSLDESFYEDYSEIIAQLALHGLMGLGNWPGAESGGRD